MTLAFTNGIDVVWYGPLMVAVFTFLSLYTYYGHGVEENMCKVNWYYDYHEHEGYVCNPQCYYHYLGVLTMWSCNTLKD